MPSRRRAGILAALAALTACTSDVVPDATQLADGPSIQAADTAAIELDLEAQIAEQVKRELATSSSCGRDVECPSSVEWQVDDTFRCAVKVSGFPRGYAQVTLVERRRADTAGTSTTSDDSAAGRHLVPTGSASGHLRVGGDGKRCTSCGHSSATASRPAQ